MSSISLRHNKDGYYQLRIAPGPVGYLNQIGQRVLMNLNSAGGTWVYGSRVGAKRPQGRHRVSIATGDWKARRLAATKQVMEKAVASAGGG